MGGTFTLLRMREDVFILRLAGGDNAEVGLRFTAFNSAAEEGEKVLRLN